MRIVNTGVPLSQWRQLVHANTYQRIVLLPDVVSKVWDSAHILGSNYSAMGVRNRIALWLHKMDERRRNEAIASIPVVTEPQFVPTASMRVSQPELYMRVNIVKGAKGEYRGETSVHVTHRGTVEEVANIAHDLIQAADREFRYEVERRERVDVGIEAS